MSIDLVVLNFNGRDLLGECLPSVLLAAHSSRHNCQVLVIDNASTDDSIEYLAQNFPRVRVLVQPNRGLCSFNAVLPNLTGQIAVLLNNDIKLAAPAIDALVEPLLNQRMATRGADAESKAGQNNCFMTAPLCWLFDGTSYEGLKTAVRWRWGLVQATALFPGHETTIHEAGLTASAGAVLAVDRQRFLELGGFDPLFLPGRLEDLDFAFRGYQAGYHACYVPTAAAFHKGQASFGKAFGADGCLQLALRNTLLFQWKNLRHPWHVVRNLVSIPARLAYDLIRSAVAPPGQRFAFTRALCGALARLPQCRQSRKTAPPSNRSWSRERDFFRRFSFDRMASSSQCVQTPTSREESHRARRHPISRWYLCPAAGKVAGVLSRTSIRPWHVTLCGLGAAILAVAVLVALPKALPAAALLVFFAWFCDRVDGQLARRQNRASPRGAWLDANIDELCDLGLHAAAAWSAAVATSTDWPWIWLIAFLAGKYLLMYGLAASDAAKREFGEQDSDRTAARPVGWLRAAYHLPGNADVRTHLFVIALATGYLTLELALIAIYYNIRWMARYALLMRQTNVGRLDADSERPSVTALPARHPSQFASVQSEAA